ncbi:polyunsaturated fatty acid lipoxygenase ALOX8-like isoform X2 [Rana temporaria]|uniref:polyunsaturated fatty acid lipoxygenase ALOX8-like isoform X2 n=1 Tax=Rana temporaria TaxID=8407 RepID=UPI001AAD743F|nr:polyunsaturated fatty acid lipoxygenase ALOX8-like isoform X2 [Rana temporaria]
MYKLKVVTGTDLAAGTCSNVSIVLVGVHGESDVHQLPHQWSNFISGAVKEFNITVNKDLGELMLVRLSMERYLNFQMDPWYCNYVTVTCPKGQRYQFPLYQWIFKSVEIPEGKGVVITKNTHPVLQQQRKLELEMNRETHNGLEVKLNGYALNTDSWHILEDIHLVASLRRSQYSDIVSKIWKEDSFFGSQYLNGLNPTLIKKCVEVPGNFPVTDQMVAPSLGACTNLQKEIQNGHIFLADYAILQGVPANTINEKPQYMATPMCLLWKNPQDQLVPIAIQLSQTPGKDVPIFLPSDSEFDWILAKIWVRSADFQVHEAGTHLLNTHLLAEVFSIATTRQLPMGHPLYKLIIPHFRYTLEINSFARTSLIGPGGVFDQASVTGRGGIPVILKKAMDEVTYISLCLPDDIKGRGMEHIPNYLYRDDGMKIWAAMESFVSNIINYYYTSDEMVKEDPELQAWVAEIFKEGFLQNKCSEVPYSLGTRASLIKYLTMVIFRCSAQHAAVNSGQFDFYSWMPNGPTTMKSPPPSTKGDNTMETILKALPDVNSTAAGISTVRILSTEPMDRRRLGEYPNERFTEKTPQLFIKKFQQQLSEISKCIQERNETMRLPYPYLDPSQIENSVSI